jgi:glycosyltransferase involved in cell wall biosynthesis
MTQTTEIPQMTNPSAHATTRVAVCIATYRRPDHLRRLLRALEQLEFRASALPSVCVIVVDNDSSLAAGFQVCKEIPSFRWTLEALREERKGISFARNRALHRALELEVDVIVFVDDDEVPEPEWLDGLLQVHGASGAEIVSGPVEPWFEESVPDWVIQGNFFDRGRFPTGTEIPFARTGNLLLDARFLKSSGLRFDERFGLTGGEDTLLTLKLKQLGARIVWADGAPVRESVPRDRATAQYILRRSFVGGNNWTRIECLLNPSLFVILKRAAIACGRVAQGTLLLVPSVVLGRHAVVRNLATVYLGLGALLALLRFSFEFYE